MREFTVQGELRNSKTGRVKIRSFAPDLYQSFPDGNVQVDELIGLPKGTFVRLAFVRQKNCTKLIDYYIERNES